MDEQLIIRRRPISAEDLTLIRSLIEQEGARGRTYISKCLCEIWDWRQSNGRFREIACRDLLRRLQTKGLIELPAMLGPARRPGYRNKVRDLDLLDRIPLTQALSRLREQIEITLIREPKELQLFRDFIANCHYLGYQQPTGEQLKYLAYYQKQPIACLSFGPSAYKIAARDQFIGWSPAVRQERLAWVVNNDRFLILPWVKIANLASFLLSRCVRRLRTDWQRIYHHDLALVETFVQLDRFKGSCYAAANWICVGQSRGRGRNDRFRQKALALKSIWLYPLRKNFQEILCASTAPGR